MVQQGVDQAEELHRTLVLSQVLVALQQEHELRAVFPHTLDLARALYRYEYLMREMDSDEPLWSDSVFISRDGGSFPAEVASCRRPQGNPTIFWTLKNVIRFLGLRRTSDVPKTVLKAMHIVMESATTFAQNFGTQFPAVKLAVFGYESQVPAAICLGLRSRGVLTVAVHERLASGVQLDPGAALAQRCYLQEMTKILWSA